MIKDKNRSLWQDRLTKVFKKQDPSSIESLLNLIALSMYNRNGQDIGSLYSTLGLEDFTTVLTLFSGKTITFPDKEEFEYSLLIAICYYYKNIKGMSWDEIKKELPYQKENLSTIKVGKGMSKLQKSMQDEIIKILGANDE